MSVMQRHRFLHVCAVFSYNHFWACLTTVYRVAGHHTYVGRKELTFGTRFGRSRLLAMRVFFFL